MPNEEAALIIIFMICFFAFVIVLLYVLACSWSQALSTRTDKRKGASKMADAGWPARRARPTFGEPANALRVDASYEEKRPDRRGQA